jgi:hypothetical protein
VPKDRQNPPHDNRQVELAQFRLQGIGDPDCRTIDEIGQVPLEIETGQGRPHIRVSYISAMVRTTKEAGRTKSEENKVLSAWPENLILLLARNYFSGKSLKMQLLLIPTMLNNRGIAPAIVRLV